MNCKLIDILLYLPLYLIGWFHHYFANYYAMKNLILILTAFFIVSTAISQQDKRLKGLEKELKEIMDITQAPGFAVAVVEGNKIIYAEGFGYRDIENQLPVDEHTLFAIGSCSKAFTSSILGQLRNEDKLSFDDSPIKHVP